MHQLITYPDRTASDVNHRILEVGSRFQENTISIIDIQKLPESLMHLVVITVIPLNMAFAADELLFIHVLQIQSNLVINCTLIETTWILSLWYVTLQSHDHITHVLYKGEHKFCTTNTLSRSCALGQRNDEQLC